MSVPVLPPEQSSVLAAVVLDTHWPTARIESPESVTVAEADFEVSAWLVAATVTEVTEFRGGTEMLTFEVVLPAVTVILLAAGSAGTDVAAGAV